MLGKYPVNEGMDEEDTFESRYNQEEYPVVSTLDTIVYWREFIKNLLPESSTGIIVVFQNTCTASFTYKMS
jgi:hypothetical protein